MIDPAGDRERHEKDMQDLRELRLRGLIDERRVREVLEDVGDDAALRKLSALLRGG